MGYLFTYGTLQDPQVQQYIFGRTLKGESDFISGFKKLENAVYNRYPLVIRTNDKNDSVPGMVYEVNDIDLAKADIYETTAYKREVFQLSSGLMAWLYVENSI